MLGFAAHFWSSLLLHLLLRLASLTQGSFTPVPARPRHERFGVTRFHFHTKPVAARRRTYISNAQSICCMYDLALELFTLSIYACTARRAVKAFEHCAVFACGWAAGHAQKWWSCGF